MKNLSDDRTLSQVNILLYYTCSVFYDDDLNYGDFCFILKYVLTHFIYACIQHFDLMCDIGFFFLLIPILISLVQSKDYNIYTCSCR